MRKPKSISIFFPCYNEEGNIGRVLQKALSVANDVFEDFEIIVIDDGSQDRTAQIVKKFSHHQVRLICHKINKGYGAALQTGFKNSKKDLIFYTDGDGQFDIFEIKKLLPLIDKFDVVTGYRLKRRDPPLAAILQLALD